MDYNKEIEDTLNILDGLERAEVPDSFFDEIEKKIDGREDRFMVPISFLKIAAIIIFVLNLSILLPIGLSDFNENESSINLNEDYFIDYDLTFDSYTELVKNEE